MTKETIGITEPEELGRGIAGKRSGQFEDGRPKSARQRITFQSDDMRVRREKGLIEFKRQRLCKTCVDHGGTYSLLFENDACGKPGCNNVPDAHERAPKAVFYHLGLWDGKRRNVAVEDLVRNAPAAVAYERRALVVCHCGIQHSAKLVAATRHHDESAGNASDKR